MVTQNDNSARRVEKVKVKCGHCGGTGEIECDCAKLEAIHTLRYNHSPGYYTYWGIKKCSECGQLWEVIDDFCDGTGHDGRCNRITQVQADKLIKEYVNGL